MLKNHPKGLLVAFFTNMGERFGFYTMMAILVLFLQAKYGLSEELAGEYYSWFYFAIYAMALAGGMLADWKKQYKLIILIGQIVMFLGYVIIAMPGMSLYGSLGALLIISLGNGFFKGNLQAVVGQLYDDERYSKLRDSAFMIFYMGINVGAFFAPFVATGVRNWWLKSNGFLHDASLPQLCHQYLDGTIQDVEKLNQLAQHVSLVKAESIDLGQFSQTYLDVFSRGYNWAFAVAAGAMVISLLVYIFFNKLLPSRETILEKAALHKANDAKKAESAQKPASNSLALMISLLVMGVYAYLIQLIPGVDIKFGLATGLFVAFVSYIFMISTPDEKPRVLSLMFVFLIVIFFWMSFHQNGLTLTFFARDYTVKEVGPFTNLFFNLDSILAVIATISGLVMALRSKEIRSKLIGGALTLAAGISSYLFVNSYGSSNPIAPEVFQSFNPLFIVALTPVVMGFFTWLNERNMEPSTPKKIGFGMIIASLGFLTILIGSLNIVSPHLLGGEPVPDSSRITPYWLISSYLILTVSELFLSPMGLSFVSKVAPPRFQGLMQGGWLLATAVGNKLLFVGSFLWGRIDLYIVWGIFMVCCLLSAMLIFVMMKRLEKVTNSVQ